MRAYTDLPGWRRPHGALDSRAAERHGLRDALIESMPGTDAELLVAVREEWSPTTSKDQVATALRALERAGAARRTADGWVRR